MATDVTGAKHGSGVAVLFALEREAAPFRKTASGLQHVSIHVTGIGPSRARTTVEQILADSNLPALVIVAGYCGALIEGLAAGAVVIPKEVVDLSGRVWPCAGDLGAGRLLSTNALVATSREKRELGRLHHASIVDMESATIAEACAAKGVPFLAVRSTSDTVDTELSAELLRLLSGGRVSAWKAGRALLRKPSLLGEFRRLARDTKVAGRNLAEELVKIVRTSGALHLP